MGALDGKTVLVTGAASGLGLAYARVSAREGAALVLVDRDEEELATRAGEFRAAGAEVETYVCDISDGDAVDAAWAAIEQTHGVDGAFLNAGVNGTVQTRLPDGEIDRASRETWDRVIGINLTGLFYTLQRTAGQMKRRGAGQIVVTGSTAGLRAEPLIGYAYVASKHAVHGLVKQASLELARYGIRINAIAPGPIRTNIAGRTPPPPEKLALYNRGIPLQRHGQPEELEALALLLVSDQSSFMTGGIYVADGGAQNLSQVEWETFVD